MRVMPAKALTRISRVERPAPSPEILPANGYIDQLTVTRLSRMISTFKALWRFRALRTQLRHSGEVPHSREDLMYHSALRAGLFAGAVFSASVTMAAELAIVSGDSGNGLAFLQSQLKEFEAKTGNTVKIVPMPPLTSG